MNVYFDIQRDVMNKKDSPRIDWDSLSDYVRQAIADKRLSYRLVADRAGLSHGVVGNVINKRNRQGINADTLRKLARGLEVQEDELLNIAFGRISPESDEQFTQSLFYRLYQKRQETSDQKKRELIDSVVEMLIEKA